MSRLEITFIMDNKKIKFLYSSPKSNKVSWTLDTLPVSWICATEDEINLCMNLCFTWKNFTNTGHRNEHCSVQNHQITVSIFLTVTPTDTSELPEPSFLAAIANCASSDDRWHQWSVHAQTAKERWIPMWRSNFRCMTAQSDLDLIRKKKKKD